jgi:hypothetical protein
MRGSNAKYQPLARLLPADVFSFLTLGKAKKNRLLRSDIGSSVLLSSLYLLLVTDFIVGTIYKTCRTEDALSKTILQLEKVSCNEVNFCTRVQFSLLIHLGNIQTTLLETWLKK